MFAYKLIVQDNKYKKKSEVVCYSAITAKRPHHWRSLPGPVRGSQSFHDQ